MGLTFLSPLGEFADLTLEKFLKEALSKKQVSVMKAIKLTSMIYKRICLGIIEVNFIAFITDTCFFDRASFKNFSNVKSANSPKGDKNVRPILEIHDFTHAACLKMSPIRVCLKKAYKAMSLTEGIIDQLFVFLCLKENRKLSSRK